MNGGVTSWVNQKLGVGDVIRRDYDGFVMYEGGFAQLEYNKDKVSAFVSGGLTNTSYWRKDRFIIVVTNSCLRRSIIWEAM